MLEVKEPWDICQGVLQTRSLTRPRERGMLQEAKTEGQNSVSLLISDIELQNVESALWGFILLWAGILSLCPYSSIWEQ